MYFIELELHFTFPISDIANNLFLKNLSYFLVNSTYYPIKLSFLPIYSNF